ncbi:MAG: ATP synthase F1 subunit epsilon [Candidatus Saccharimonas sp.]
MDFQLITLSGTKVNEKVYEVMLTTADGDIAVFPDHEPLVSVVVPGVISVRYDKHHSDEQLDLFAVSGGIVEIADNHMRVLVDEADHGEDIIEAENRAALERAIAMRDNASSQIELEKAHNLVNRHSVRLKVADLHRRKRRL